MIKRHSKAENIVIASNFSTGHPEEYIRKCDLCKNSVFLVDDWRGVKIKKIICIRCFSNKMPDSDVNRIHIEPETIKSINKELGTSFTKAELILLTKQIKEVNKDRGIAA